MSAMQIFNKLFRTSGDFPRASGDAAALIEPMLASIAASALPRSATGPHPATPDSESAAPAHVATPAGDATADPADERLMELCGTGDSDAFALLFRRYERLARTFVGRTLRDFDAAEDVVQEAFLAIWTEAPRWRTRGKFRSYLLTILSRRTIDYLRRRRPGIETEWTLEAENRPAPIRSAVELLARSEDHQRLAAAIDRLPERQRMVVLLFYSEQLSMKEIAGMLAITPKSVESLLSRAREGLRTDLGAAQQ